MGTAPWMPALSRTLSATRRDQLCRIRSFLGYETARQYFDKKGRRRCVCSSISHDLSVFSELLFPYPKVGGRDLHSTQVYPGSFGLEVLLSGIHPWKFDFFI